MDTAIPRWLPNAISTLRLLLVPVLLWTAWQCESAGHRSPEESTWRFVTLGVLFLIGVSDIVDGTLARRYGLATVTGALLDAIADKVCQIALVMYLLFTSGHAFVRMPVWFAAIILGRDVVLGGGVLLLRKLRPGFHYTHRIHGKAAAVAIFGLLVWFLSGWKAEFVPVGLGFVSVLIVISTFAYAAEALRSTPAA